MSNIMEAQVEQFVAITGAPYPVARSLLEACGGNLELAVNMHMEGSGGTHSATPQKPGGPSKEQSDSISDELLSPTSYEAKHGVRAPIPQSSGVLIEEDHAPRRALRSRRLPQTVFDPFQDYRNTGKIGGPGDSSKKRSLAELFKPPYDIMFHGTFLEAKLSGQQQRKWLLVNLQDSKEFSSQVLNRDVWSNHNIKDIVKQNFVFWQVFSITDEGLKFKQLYHVTKFPFVAVIDPMTGEKMADWGSLSVAKFTGEILEFLSSHQYDSTVPSASKTQESVADKSEESMLKEAIQASLRDATAVKKKQQLVFSDDSDVDCVSLNSADSEDEVEFIGASVGGASTVTRLLDEGQLYSVEEQTVPESSSSGMNGYNTRGSRKRRSNRCEDELAEELPRKMMKTDISESSSWQESNRSLTEDVHSILFRLPDGSRIQNRFISSRPIKELFQFLKSKGIDENDHEIVTQFPRRNLCEMNPTLSFKDLGLHPRETVFIHTTE